VGNPKGRADEIDAHVGARLRIRRNLLGVSQEILADKLGITFQQLQKYEKGVNRIGASRLYKLSQLLNVPLDYFFEQITNGLDYTNALLPTKGLAENKQAGYGKGSAKKPVPLSVGTSYNIPEAIGDPLLRKETADLINAYYNIPDKETRRRVLDLANALGAALHGTGSPKENVVSKKKAVK